MDQSWIIIILLGAVIFIYAFIQYRGSGKATASAAGSVTEMEQAFAHFAEDIEEDNRMVMEHVSSLRETYEQRVRELSDRMDERNHQLFMQFEERHNQLVERMSRLEIEQIMDENHAPARNVLEQDEHGLIETKSESPLIRERYAEVFELFQQGKSIEHIAKKAGMNTGEVQLVLTLGQQEEAPRAKR